MLVNNAKFNCEKVINNQSVDFVEIATVQHAAATLVIQKAIMWHVATTLWYKIATA